MKDFLEELVPGKPSTGDLISVFRTNWGIEIDWVSNQTLIPKDLLLKYEHNLEVPTEEHLELIADALGVRTKDLL